jgi:hypothetical protein
MDRLDDNIELAKNLFINYCADKYPEDQVIQNMFNDLLYFQDMKAKREINKARRSRKGKIIKVKLNKDNLN